jgi:hypothetical protein
VPLPSVPTLRGLARGVVALWLAGLCAATFWVFAQNPFAQPLVDRTAAETARALDRAMAIHVTPEWLAAETEAALDKRDPERLDTLAAIAEYRGLALDPAQAARIAALRAEREGFLAQARTCAACMADIAACPSLPLMAACGVPFELTPLGDANALRREALAYATGQEVDELTIALALTGLGATAAVVVSGGSSATVKAGATLLRVARRLGTLTPGFAADLFRLSDLGLDAGKVRAFALRTATLEETVDMDRFARLGTVAADLGRVASNTGPAEALLLLRHVESAEDAARLARFSDAAGPATRGILDTLGAPRAFRALVRLSDVAFGAFAILWLVLGQIAGAAGALAAGMVLRGLKRSLRPR